MSVYDNILDDDDSEAGIHEGQLAEAISVWAWMQSSPKPQTVAAAALTFNTTPALVRRVIAIHPWAFLTGPDDDPTKQRIEHDGE
jgi:hypothetical protein